MILFESNVSGLEFDILISEPNIFKVKNVHKFRKELWQLTKTTFWACKLYNHPKVFFISI